MAPTTITRWRRWRGIAAGGTAIVDPSIGLHEMKAMDAAASWNSVSLRDYKDAGPGFGRLSTAVAPRRRSGLDVHVYAEGERIAALPRNCCSPR